MELKKNTTEQKLRGAYYTPKALAKFIVNYFAPQISKSEITSILEPSCGDGIFIEELNNIPNIENVEHILGVEIEKEEAEKARSKALENTRIVTGDFIKLYNQNLKDQKYDLVLGNPPYIRYQYLDEEQRKVQSDILVHNGMKSNKLINAWVCFLVASIELLNEGGNIGFVIPAELLQVAYAEDLRLFLSNTLEEIILVTFKELVFNEIEQEVVVLIGTKNTAHAREKAKLAVKQLDNLDCLNNINMKELVFQEIEHTKEKWTKYFVEDNHSLLINHLKQDKRFIKLGDIALVNVGITTGNNKYFCVDRQSVADYNLENAVLPLIGRSSHAHGIYFTQEDFQTNVNNNKKAYLVSFPADIEYSEYPEGYKRYIEEGELREENTGYKCRIRDRWYIVPSIWIPDAFLLRRNNRFPKFVLNDIGAVSTDTMHRIKFNEGIDRDKVLLSYYNSISFAFTEICGRSYGGGVLEILPGEASQIILPDLTNFDQHETNRLLQCIDNAIRNDLDIEAVLDEIDRVILVEYLGIDQDVCTEFRCIWKTLMERRHTRGK